MPRLCAIFITHTHERIARSVMSMAAQTTPPDAVVVSCDADTDDIRREVARAARLSRRPVLLVARPQTGQARPAQTRNNAVRALDAAGGLSNDDRLVFFDGDCMAPPGVLAVHAEALGRAHLSLGWRIELDAEQTARLSDDDALSGAIAALPTPAQRAQVARAHRAHLRRAVQRALGLIKPHKPQVLGANFGVRAWVYRALNGMDETYTGWGMEDDDFGKRAYALGARPALRLGDCVVLHQHHPTRSRGRWTDNEQAHRVALPCPTVCLRGLTSPLEQPDPVIAEITPNAPAQTPPPEPKPARVARAS